MGAPCRFHDAQLACLAMHHIYSGEKKAAMETGAAQLGIGGFYVQGKPGRLVAEGPVTALWRYVIGVRRLRWSNCKVMGRVLRAHPDDAWCDAAAASHAGDVTAAANDVSLSLTLPEALVNTPALGGGGKGHAWTAAVAIPTGPCAETCFGRVFTALQGEDEMRAVLAAKGLAVVGTLVERPFSGTAGRSGYR